MTRAVAWTIFAVIVIAIGLTFCSRSAPAAEDRGAWFKSLKQPDTGYSCCDISDCRATEADFRNGQWWAVVRGEWVPIPPNKEVTDKTSIDGDAYVCASPTRNIYCFVRPDFGT